MEQRAPVLEVPVEAASGDAERLGKWLDPYGVRAAGGKGPQAWHLIVYPPLMRQIEQDWQAGGGAGGPGPRPTMTLRRAL